MSEDWLVTPDGPEHEPAKATVEPTAPEAPAAELLDSHAGVPGAGRPRGLLSAALVMVGLVGGLVGGLAWAHSGATRSAASTSPAAQNPTGAGDLGIRPDDGFGGFGGGGFVPGGRVAGEQRVVGTLSAVGGSTVTVRTVAGTDQTYAVNGTTQIVRDGQPVALAALRPGDRVFAHVLPTRVAGHPLLERLFAGTGQGLYVPGQGPGASAPPAVSGTGQNT